MQATQIAKKRRVKPVPDGYTTVTPFVIVKDAAKFLGFLHDAFDAQEIDRMTNEDGTIGHAETKICDAIIMTFDAKPGWPDTPAFLRLYVKDCDATYQQALQAGAMSVTEPVNMPWGDRVCRVRDPFGNIWWLMTRQENVSPKEMEARMQQPEYKEAMKYVEGADFFLNSKK